MSVLKKLSLSRRQLFLYALFGVLTTVVNIAVYGLCTRIIDISMPISNAFAWFFAVLFAYLTQRLWVFGTSAHTILAVIRETVSFFGCRVFTGILDMGVMYIGIELLYGDDLIVKCVANFLVILANYVGSKLIVFHSTTK